jgi:hypothetical protein
VTNLEPHEPTAVDPRSGEVIDLANAPHADLVEAFLILQDHERRAKEWRTAVEDELVSRHGDHRGPAPVGDFVVDIDRGFTRAWDVVELEEVVHDLVNRGLLDRAYAGVIVEGEPKVDGKEAARLLSRVSGDALLEIRRCFCWEQKGRARVKVTAPQQLTK